MFEKFYDAAAVAQVLVPAAQYHPFPRCGEANSFTEAQKEAMIKEGEKFLNYDWPVAKAMDYMKYITEGTRVPYEMRNYAARREALGCLMNAELAENKGRFIPDLINGFWAIMDEATWVVPAHNYLNEGYHKDFANKVLPDFDREIIIDLFSAGTAGMLCNAYYLFKEQFDAVTPLVCNRFEKVIDERILTPFMENIYWWTGLIDGWTNNWCPWIISNILTAFGVACKDDDRRAKAIARALPMVEVFLKMYHPDGGCDEGPSYWGVAGASLFDCLEELCDLSNGKMDFFGEPLVQNIGRYIYRAHIGKKYFTNYADAPLNTRPSGDLIYRFGQKMQDADMIDMGVAMFNLSSELDGGKVSFGSGAHNHYRHVKALYNYAELSTAKNNGFPLLKNVFIDGIEMIAERQEKGADMGLYLSAKGGHNAESHNHNDIGSFVIYSDSVPTIVDIGSGLYNAKTFSAQRYEIMQMQSNYHNLPIVNGCGQLDGREYCSSNVSYELKDCGCTVFSENLVKAYDPKAGLNSLQRTFVYNRTDKKICIEDKFAFAADENAVDFVFMVPTQPEITDGSVLVSPVGATPVEITFDKGLQASFEQIDVSDDNGLMNNWGQYIYRVLVHAEFGKEGSASFTFAQKK